MLGLFGENKKNNSWFSWDGMDKGCGRPFDWPSYDGDSGEFIPAKEPERDYFSDWLDLKWAYGDPDFDPLKPL